MSAPRNRWRIPLAILVATGLVALAAVAFTRSADSLRPLVGVDWAQSSSGAVAVHVEESSPAARAGVVLGDVLLEVGGKPIRSALDAAELAWRGEDGEPIALTVSRGGGEVVLEIRPEWRPENEPYVYLYVVGLAFGLSGLLIFLRWPRLRGGTVYTFLCTAMFLHLTLSPTGAADPFDWAVEWIDVVAGALVPALLFHVALALTKRTLRWRRSALGVAYGVAGVMILAWIWLSPVGLGGAYRLQDPVRGIEILDRLGYLVTALAIVAASVLLAKSHSRSSSAMHRGQMRWLLWGLTIGLGPFFLLYAIPWIFDAADPPGWARFLSVLPLLLVPAAFTAAMARYRLHDVDLLLLRGVTEVGAVLVTAAVYSLTVFVLRDVVSGLIPLSSRPTRYVGFLVAAVAYPQVRAWVKGAVERAFYRQRYSYRATLLDWARELNAETDLPSLLGLLRRRVKDTVGVREAEVLIRRGAWRFEAIDSPGVGPIDLDEASLERLENESSMLIEAGSLANLPWARYLFPMKVKGNLRAVLAISIREGDDASLTTEDRSLLVTLAAHAATAIEAARLVLEVRHRADQIERLHARQARILESSAVGLLLLDGESRIQAWNRALEEIYGMPRDEAIGKLLGEVFPLHVVRKIDREGGQASQEARIFRLNMVNRHAQRVVVNISIASADDDEALPGGRRVVTFDDVTRHVRLEEQVLQQERLASLGMLAAGVAHEINTPLTGISSYTQLLLEELSETDPRREVLEKIETQTGRASRIANSLLTLARPQRSAFEETDVNETVREVLQLFEPQVRGRDIELHAELDPGVPVVMGHRGKLQQVFLNLLLNARDAVAEGGEIRLASRRGSAGVVVEVTDNGAGIAKDDLPRIFDPFFTTKERGEGTGLGLSITYGIVQEHEGTIDADSAPGGLTRFLVELPTAQAARALAR